MDALGIIMAYSGNDSLRELTDRRTPASLPFGGRYRLIDFALSSLVNSDITKVGIITHHNYQSLMDHVGNGKDWDLSRKTDGLFIIPPFARGEGTGGEVYKGWVDALAAARTFIHRSENKYVVLLPGDYVYNINFEDILKQHEQNNADISVVYTKAVRDHLSKDYVYRMQGQRVIDVLMGTDAAAEPECVSSSMFIMKRTLLERLVREASTRGQNSIMRDIIYRNLSELNICGYEFKGYCRHIDSVGTYLTSSMDMLNAEVRAEIFENARMPVYTKVRDEMPVQYREGARVSNALIADGCIIEGEVENSVLFRGVCVEKGASVRNSILMQNAEVLSGANINNVIMDKQSVVRGGKMLIGQANLPVLVGKDNII